MSCPIIANPILFGLTAGAVGFVAGLAVANLGKKRRYAVADSGDWVELYVGNLSYDMTEEHMLKEFQKYGAVKSARIIANRFNNKSKGYGFVEMPNRSEAEAAIRGLHDKDILGRKLRVNEAKNKSHE